MRKPFKLLKEAAHEIAETLGVSLDETFTLSGMGYEFEQFTFDFRQQGEENGMKFRLSISADDLDLHFRDLP